MIKLSEIKITFPSYGDPIVAVSITNAPDHNGNYRDATAKYNAGILDDLKSIARQLKSEIELCN